VSLQRHSPDKTTRRQDSTEPVGRQNVLFGLARLLRQDTDIDALIQDTVHKGVDCLGAECSAVFELLPQENPALFCKRRLLRAPDRPEGGTHMYASERRRDDCSCWENFG